WPLEIFPGCADHGGAGLRRGPGDTMVRRRRTSRHAAADRRGLTRETGVSREFGHPSGAGAFNHPGNRDLSPKTVQRDARPAGPGEALRRPDASGHVPPDVKYVVYYARFGA